MTRAVPHDVAREELAGTALDALAPAERSAVLAHVAECAECRAELAAYEEASALLALAVPVRPLDAAPSARVRARLLARAAAHGTAAPAHADVTLADASLARPAGGAARASRAGVASRWVANRWVASRWLAAAAVVAFAVTAALLARATGERDAARLALRAGEARALARADSLSAALAGSEAMVAALTGPSVRVVELSAAGAREPVARMFWDRAANRWTMVAHNLPRPRQGMTYQLWLVTGKEKISAGTFQPTAAGDAMMQAQYSLAADALRAVAVTEEPMGGMPQPTGPMVIVGKAGA